jgi:uncharacterized protein YdbL (DUF1318 family)
MKNYSFFSRSPFIFVFTLGVSLSLMLPGMVWALNLDQAKAQGLLGETPSGYLELVRPDAGTEAQAVREDINRRRKQEYLQIAQKNGSPLAAVEALAGKKAIENTPAGRFVKLDGRWVKK